MPTPNGPAVTTLSSTMSTPEKGPMRGVAGSAIPDPIAAHDRLEVGTIGGSDKLEGKIVECQVHSSSLGGEQHK